MKERNIRISDKIDKGNNITQRGNDLKKGQVLLKEGTWLSAADIGLIASVGISDIPVYKKVKVAVLSTGNELAEPGSNLGNASVFDSNRFMLFSMIRKCGGEPIDLGICRDEKSLIQAKIMQALKFDVILVSGGSSVGEKDYVPDIINEIGQPGIIIRGIAMKPGFSYLYRHCKWKAGNRASRLSCFCICRLLHLWATIDLQAPKD